MSIADARSCATFRKRASSAYGDASVRHLLDMTVSLDFVESYLDPESIFALYRESTGMESAATGP